MTSHLLKAAALALTTTLLGLAGCQSDMTLSAAARSGDTVLVGLSGEPEAPVTNTTFEILRADDISATLTDSAGANRRVRVRSVFRTFGDPTANSLAARQGQWLAVVDLLATDGTRHNLATGDAELVLRSGKLVEDVRVKTTILAGTGDPHPLLGAENSLNKLNLLQPAEQSLVWINGDLAGQRLGAVQLQFHVDQETMEGPFGPLAAIDAVKLQGRRDISYQQWLQAPDDGGTDLHVIMTAPEGIAQDDLHEFNLALLSGQINRVDDPATYFSNSLRRAQFYSVEGERLTGLRLRIGRVQ